MSKKISKSILKKRAKKKLIAEQNKQAKLKYNEWARAVKERDNYTCQISGICYKGKDPKSLNASHILSKENYPELMYDIMNGISLSFFYHKNAPISSHLDGFAFTLWLKKNKPEQYEYLKNFLEEKWKSSIIPKKDILQNI